MIKQTVKSLKLSKREIQVLQAVFQGNTAAEAAKRLQITTRTVNFHLANAYRKLGVNNRMEARNAVAKQFQQDAK